MSDALIYAMDIRGVARITLNRPEVHNAFDEHLIQAMTALLREIHDNSAVKIVVLAAAGKNFSAGADLNWMRSMAGYSYAENVRDALALSELMQTLKFLNQPTIACVQGAAYGGGVGLVACCDMAVAADSASFCLSEVKIGLIPAVISPYVITAIGERAARRYSLTAEPITAREAYRLGLISVIAEADQLEIAVEDLITRLLQNSPQAVQAAKALINRVSASPYEKSHLQKNAEAIAAIRVSAEGQEGLNAFMQKRKPAWQL